MRLSALAGTLLLSLAFGEPAAATGDPDAPRVLSPAVVVRRADPSPRTYVRFDLSPLLGLPPGTPLGRALLRAWAGSAAEEASVEVHAVLDPWTEGALAGGQGPTLGPVIATVRRRTRAVRHVTLDVTGLVQDWLDGTLPNEGLALLPGDDSPGEAGGAGLQPMELEVTLEQVDAVRAAPVDGPPGPGTGDGPAASLGGPAEAGPTKGPPGFWTVTGNAGMLPRINFLGTTDDTALDFRVNDLRALRLEPHATSPNVVGGYAGNVAGVGVYGATIGGGGRPGEVNSVTANLGTVGGGANHTAGSVSTVGGGYLNTASGEAATIAGGSRGTASGSAATVGGGYKNNATVLFATVGGGESNWATGQHATVAGGFYNQAGGDRSFAGGSRAKVRDTAESGSLKGDQGTFVWADVDPSPYPSYFASTGPNQFLIRARGGVAINTNTPVQTTTPNEFSALTVSGQTTLDGNLSFAPSQSRQLIDMAHGFFGIGVQVLTMYFRTSNSGGFAWYQAGSHADGNADPGGGTRQMRLDAAGNLYVRGTVNAGGADFAEMLPAREDAAPGDVLAIGPDGRLARSTEPYQRSLAGVYSTKPGLLGGAADGEDLTGKAPLAVSGVIPVKVTAENGPITPGDPLTSSSTPGRAMKATEVRMGGAAFLPSGVVLGKALEPLASGEGVIQVLVVLQ